MRNGDLWLSSNTVRVDTPNETHHVDAGFIVFNDRNYPNFERLLEGLGVGWKRSTMSFSVSDGIGDFEYSSASANGLLAKRAHLLTPWFHGMIADLARFIRAAREPLGDHADDLSLGGWLERHRFSRAFIERLIVPQASAVGSADPGDPAHVMRTIPYAHPVYTAAGLIRAQARLDEIDGRNRTHFCGAYWGSGFYEDGVVSGLRVGERFGARL